LKIDIAIHDQLLQGTKVSYGGTAAFNAGVGEKARADARIILEGIKNSATQTRTSQSNYVVWQTLVNSGTKTETLVLPTFSGPTSILIGKRRQ
jgi:filamentous hemagglutinin